ncbi:biopolymer transporter ExbB [Flavipsychrobacter stenotrophus]|uniref:Biopolymer transporter ExbB n=1 Tax=Flavipsychrobacter stenotrophus TaxID=2077091 RepID=A0A2S7SRA3_9BACT|nr:MotA/TolQ/ExbB proton channel family protein [Flavipsychrobacter stenotrophus]PQJ09076.1 biopolymer transporter ExbB [Flavipsychrobacter stenotrophus]
MQILSVLFLQAATVLPDTAAKVVTQAATVPAEKISLFHLLMEGGVLMIPLLLCSLVLVYVFFERLSIIRKASVIDDKFMARIREQVVNKNIEAAKASCRTSNTPVARIIEKGLERVDKPYDIVEKTLENNGKLEVYKLERNLSVINAIAGIAPVLGFLGTIAGMIILFFNVQHQGFSLETIAGGIYTKMVTSASGLIIGLFAYLGSAYLNAQINKSVNRMEAASVEFLDIVMETKGE